MNAIASKMKSIAVIAMMLLSIGVGNVWGASCNDWLTDGIGGGTYADIYKVLCPMTLPAGGYVVNVQKPWGTKPGIYFNNMGTGVTACSLGDGNWSNNGGTGLLLHLDALTNQETEVTVTVGGNDYTFTVYNKNGTTGGGGGSSCDTKHFYYVKYESIWSNPTVYMWNSSNTSEKNASWPGVSISTKATDIISPVGDLIYEISYTDQNYDKVIFSDNGSSKTGDLDIQNCKFYWNGTWYDSLEDIEEFFVFFINTSSWTDSNVKAHIWKNGGSVMHSWNEASEQMTLTSTTTNDNHKIYYYYVSNPSSYDKVKFHNSGNNGSADLNLEYGNYFNYADNQWYTSTKYLNFSNSGWTLIPFIWSDYTSTVQTTKVTISNAESDYEFNIKSAGASYYYNHGKMTNSNCTDWKFNENSSQNCWIDPDVAGDYIFKYDFAENKLSVVYPPSMTSATLYSKTHNSATLTVASTRGTKYNVTNSDGSVEYTVSNGGVADGNGHITVTGLTPGTQYSFKVYALDDNDTESANYSSVSAFYTLPVMGTATLNTRTYNSITLEVTGTGASQYRVVNTSPAVDQTITPSDGKITVTSLSPNTSYTFTVTAKNAGGDASANSVVMSAIYTTPQMTTATLDSKTQTTVVLNVASNGGATYKVTNTSGDEYTLSSSTPTDGKITVTGLTAGTSYTFRVYAISGSSSLVSSNYIDVTTSTYPNVNSGPTGYYDCQVKAIHTSGDEYSPKGMILADWSYAAGGAAYEDGSRKKAYKVNTNTTFYAGLYFGSDWTGTPTTLCNASSCTKLHVEFWSAEAQSFNFNVIAYYNSQNNDGTPQSVTTTAGSWKVMDFTITDFGTTVSDHKDVISAFKIDYGSGNTGKELIIANAYFYTPDVCESMKCHGSGSAGSGLTINGAKVFESGESYWTKAYMYNGRLHIDAKFTHASKTVAAAYVQFIKLDGGVLGSWAMTNKTDSFVYNFAPSDVTDAYKYGGVARYSVKFEVTDDGIRNTDYHYYDFTNSECAPDYFDIYHYDDATGSQRTEYAGGTILQPIRYFRHFEHTDWCAITFPFTVSKVVVDEGGTEYDLYPRFNNGSSDVEGYYWLKTFDNWNSTPVAISEFQSAWKQLTVSTASSDDAVLAGLVKPAKDVPYVIAFPDGSYYGTYWVIFYGDAGQTIDSSEDSGCGTSFSGDGETVKLQRNNMMQPTSSKTNIYLLEEGHNYYSRQTQAIPAFESYVIGTATVQGKYRVLRMDNVSTPETPTDIDALPTTECRGAIYSLSGMRIATFADRDAMEQLLSGLSAGVYVVRAGAVINKVVVQ